MPALVRAVLRDLLPYRPVDAANTIDLSDNTNLWGPPPAAVDAVHALAGASLRGYPATPPANLVQALADYAGVAVENVVPGCGSDDLLDCAMRAFADSGDTIAFAVPTFSMIPAFAAINGLRAHAVPLNSDFDIDVDALLAPSPRLVYLCSPNNPTGTALRRETIARVVRDAPGVVVLDEAYAEFTDAPGFELLASADRLVVTRTLSKAFGLAGLRVGYAVLAAPLARALETVRGPYKLNAAGAAAATAALTDGLDWVRDHAAEAVGVRQQLVPRLAAAGFTPLPSEGNFFCIPCRDADSLAAQLLERGFAVRVFRGLPSITPGLAASSGLVLRVSVGPWSIMEQLLEALNSIGNSCE